MQPVDLGCDSRKQGQEVGKQRQEKETQEGCVRAHAAPREGSDPVYAGPTQSHPQGALGTSPPNLCLVGGALPLGGSFQVLAPLHHRWRKPQAGRPRKPAVCTGVSAVISRVDPRVWLGPAGSATSLNERGLEANAQRGPKGRGSRCICNTTPHPIFASEEPTLFLSAGPGTCPVSDSRGRLRLCSADRYALVGHLPFSLQRI